MNPNAAPDGTAPPKPWLMRQPDRRPRALSLCVAAAAAIGLAALFVPWGAGVVGSMDAGGGFRDELRDFYLDHREQALLGALILVAALSVLGNRRWQPMVGAAAAFGGILLAPHAHPYATENDFFDLAESWSAGQGGMWFWLFASLALGISLTYWAARGFPGTPRAQAPSDAPG